jgi:hypothetical protein
MANRRLLAIALAGSALGIAAAHGLLAAAPRGPERHICPPCQHVRNAFIEAVVGPNGSWTMGTTGGDPGTVLDDDTNLLYGFTGLATEVGSTYATLRVRGPAGTYDESPPAPASQFASAESVDTVWLARTRYRARVTQTLRLAHNPFSGRSDIVDVRYEALNEDVEPLEIGLRTVLDVKVGTNDGAPYIVPGVGNLDTEREFVGPAVPPFWLAFESDVYDPRQLRTIGILRAPGLTPPDRLVVAAWPHLASSQVDWGYPARPGVSVTEDSAVVLFWEPRRLLPGERWTARTAYGVAGTGGGSAFLSGPVSVECGATFSVAMFVNNFGADPLTGGRATLTLPGGVALAPGESATQALPTIEPGGTGSAVWQLVLTEPASARKAIDASATFDNGQTFEARAEMDVCPAVPTAVPPTATATVSPTPSRTAAVPTVTLTATASPSPPPTHEADAAQACEFILNRVPAAAISFALANPEQVSGWQELRNPSAPPGPSNPRRTQLSLQNISAPFHRQFNPLVYKAGCP